MAALSLRALNRATLDRQLLLCRHARPARWAIGHLTALQAQAPLAPYVGLWTRLAGFRHEDLEGLLTERSVVRAHLLRNTVHLLTAEDFVGFRALFRPLMERGLAANFGRNLRGVDTEELKATAAALLTQGALTRTQLAARLAERWPDRDPASLAYAATHLLVLVQVPPRGRVIPHDRPVPLPPGRGAATGTLLVDGFWQADWKITKGQHLAVLHILPFRPLGPAEADAIAAEGRRLLEFAAPAAAHDVRFAQAS
jgi:Winged helix DNA-binding domain